MQVLAECQAGFADIADDLTGSDDVSCVHGGGACNHVGIERGDELPVDDVVDDYALPEVGGEVYGADDAVCDGGYGLPGVVGEVCSAVEGVAALARWRPFAVGVGDRVDGEGPDDAVAGKARSGNVLNSLFGFDDLDGVGCWAGDHNVVTDREALGVCQRLGGGRDGNSFVCDRSVCG